MRRRVMVVTMSAGVLLLLACSAGGRTGSGHAPAPAVSTGATATAKAIELLRSGTTFIDRTSFRVDADIAGQVTTLARQDNVNKRAVATMSESGRVTEVRMIGDEIYFKTQLGFPGVGDGWMVLDPARVPPDFALTFAPGRNDPGGSARLISAVVTARVDGSRVTGTIDLTRVGSGTGISLVPGPEGFPDWARSTAFEATLDADSRLVSFLIPGGSGMPDASLRYSDFGAQFEVARPQGAVPAPDALYPQPGMHG